MSWIVRIAPLSTGPDCLTGDGGATSRSESLLDSLLASALWDLGTTGMAEVDGDLIAGFDDRSGAERAVEHLARFANYKLYIHPVSPAQDPAGVSPGGRAQTCPMPISWARDPFELRLVSDGVFGHGRHPTTQLALDLLLGHLARRHTPPTTPKATVLDVGTGTGVLAIAAAKTGMADVTAVDIDALARSTAIHNAEQNNAEVRITDSSPTVLAEHGHHYDMILANVLLAQHRELATPIVSALGTTTAGLIVLSGYLVEQTADVFDAYLQPGFTTTVVAAAYRGQWAGHLLRVDTATAL